MPSLRLGCIAVTSILIAGYALAQDVTGPIQPPLKEGPPAPHMRRLPHLIPSGSIKANYTYRESRAIPDQPDHVLTFSVSKGINKSTGMPPALDEAEVTQIAYADLIQGNGSYEGYVTLGKGEVSSTAKLFGLVTTNVENGQPKTTINGTFRDVSGPFVGKTGTFTAHMTPDNNGYTADWRFDKPLAMAEAQAQIEEPDHD
jgi:hypothetical protein